MTAETIIQSLASGLLMGLRRFHEYYGDGFTVECRAGSGSFMNLSEVADEVSRRIIGIFHRDASERRPVLGSNELFQTDANWRDLIPFYEYFHGDTGRGVGASHQTGWTAVVACMIHELSEAHTTVDDDELALATASA